MTGGDSSPENRPPETRPPENRPLEHGEIAGPTRAFDLTNIVPLTGRRTLARGLGVTVLACLAGGIAGVVVEGRASRWAGLLSLPVPGLGQLVQGRTLAGLLMIVIALFVLVDLFALFNRVLRLGAVPLVMLAPAGALHAATRGAGWSIPIGAAAGLAIAFAVEAINVSSKRRRMARVAGALAALPATATVRAYENLAHGPVAPLDRFAEAYLRYFLHFGHAAPDDWSVFDDPKHVDAALRYQIVLSSWALYVSQHLATPAFRQSAGIAVGNLAERLRDYRVWGYTRRQHFTSFRFDGDPFAYENVMYAGYAADVISMYEALTGDRRYDAPGGYSVSDPHRTYEWSHEEIVDNLALQHGASVHGAISCVPGWLWPPCQSFSLRAIQLGDLVHGTDHHWALERFDRSFGQYFVDADGHIDTCRHIAGFVHPTDALIVGISGQSGTGALMAPFGREHLERNYERQVRSRMKPPDADGRIELELSKIDTFDTSYGWNPAQPYSLTLLYATEMGDTEGAAGVRRTLEGMLTPDDHRPGPGSILSMAFTLLALVNTERGLASAHRHVPALDTTPELESAPYPHVVVTAASTDGTGVRATLAPGPAANGEVDIAFARLTPEGRYRLVVSGAARDLVADSTGRLATRVDSSTRQDLVLDRTG
jgi:hypothetical protein